MRLLFLVPRPEGTRLLSTGEVGVALDAGYANYFERHVHGRDERKASRVFCHDDTPRRNMDVAANDDTVEPDSLT
jgi:hypothetical protein